MIANQVAQIGPSLFYVYLFYLLVLSFFGVGVEESERLFLLPIVYSILDLASNVEQTFERERSEVKRPKKRGKRFEMRENKKIQQPLAVGRAAALATRDLIAGAGKVVEPNDGHVRQVAHMLSTRHHGNAKQQQEIVVTKTSLNMQLQSYTYGRFR